MQDLVLYTRAISFKKCGAWSKMSFMQHFRLFLKWHKVKKSNFQATLPHCTPVLLRKTAPCPPMNQPERDLELLLRELRTEEGTSSKIGC